MPLNQEQRAELINLVVQNFDPKGHELDEVVKESLGSGLFVDYAAPDNKFRNVVEELLTTTEQKGFTVKLFEGVWEHRRGNESIKAIIKRVLPDAALKMPDLAGEVRIANKSLNAVRDCLNIREVREQVASSRSSLERLATDLNLLACYKTLHDCLHTLQIQFLRLIANEASKLETDPNAVDNLMVYVDQLQVGAITAQTAAEGLPDTPGERHAQMKWVRELAENVENLGRAVQLADKIAAGNCVLGLKSIVRQQSPRLDQLIVITADRAPIVSLVTALEKVAAASTCEGRQGRDLADGIDALRRLIPKQMELVAQHTQWQRIADKIWLADEFLHQKSVDTLQAFKYFWEDLATGTREIAASHPDSDWAVALTRDAASFERQLPQSPDTAVSDQAKRCFGMFTSRINNRFFRVDKALHAQCSEIIKLGEPLRRLLAEIPDDGHRRAEQ